MNYKLVKFKIYYITKRQKTKAKWSKNLYFGAHGILKCVKVLAVTQISSIFALL